MSIKTWSGLVQTFSNPRVTKVGEESDPRFPPASATSQRWDKVSAKSLGKVAAPQPKTLKAIHARIQPKVRRANAR